MARPKVGLSLFTLPHALTLGPAHWDPAHAASTRQARSLNKNMNQIIQGLSEKSEMEDFQRNLFVTRRSGGLL